MHGEPAGAMPAFLRYLSVVLFEHEPVALESFVRICSIVCIQWVLSLVPHTGRSVNSCHIRSL
jgi:hypothetical protein